MTNFDICVSFVLHFCPFETNKSFWLYILKTTSNNLSAGMTSIFHHNFLIYQFFHSNSLNSICIFRFGSYQISFIDCSVRNDGLSWTESHLFHGLFVFILASGRRLHLLSPLALDEERKREKRKKKTTNCFVWFELVLTNSHPKSDLIVNNKRNCLKNCVFLVCSYYIFELNVKNIFC